jgi:hypothetical protein
VGTARGKVVRRLTYSIATAPELLGITRLGDNHVVADQPLESAVDSAYFSVGDASVAHPWNFIFALLKRFHEPVAP